MDLAIAVLASALAVTVLAMVAFCRHVLMQWDNATNKIMELAETRYMDRLVAARENRKVQAEYPFDAVRQRAPANVWDKAPAETGDV